MELEFMKKDKLVLLFSIVLSIFTNLALLMGFKIIKALLLPPEIGNDKLVGFSQYFGYPFYFDTLFFFVLLFIPIVIFIVSAKIVKNEE